jgi:hypothetical protein
MRGQHVLDEIGTDEAAASGDEQMHEFSRLRGS